MSIPKVTTQNGRKMLLVDDKPFVLLSGELHNSSSSTDEYMAPIWDNMQAAHLNSLLFPITWQQLEPVEGEFHFELVDTLIEQAKAHEMKIGVLWFGAWKNANCSYAPDWVKRDLDRFPRVEVKKGKHFYNIKFHSFRMPYTSLSAFCEETRNADAKAFAALCRHLKEVDTDHTVILIQVENETGILGAPRDQSDLADKAFAENVPSELLAGMIERKDTLDADLKAAVESGKTGSWETVFGEAADETFMAWHTAKYVEAIAEAGKAEYDLPMYANCWLAQGGKPGDYPSGGPVDRMLEVWQTAAPSLDFLAPDIYVPEFCETCDAFVKSGNPLFIPETALHSGATARLIYAIGHYHALCFAPFGIDDLGQYADTTLGAAVGMDTSDVALKNRLDPAVYARANELLAGLLPTITPLYGTDDLQAVIQENSKAWTMTFGTTEVSAYFDMPGLYVQKGACLVARTAPDTYYMLGYGCMPRFASLDVANPYMEYLTVEEGEFKNGQWTVSRVLNGDEEYIRINELKILKITTHAYN